jgi:hypothetical protein
MERVVYILGAGFSAPLGLPVVADFLVKARDLYFSRREEHKHFDDVLGQVAQLSMVKNYVEADLFDIEEVFSVLDMEEHLKGEYARSKRLSDFIRSVIVAYTPEISYGAPTGVNWWDMNFGHGPASDHSAFVASLFQLDFTRDRAGAFAATPCETDVRYDVISLNYDTVLEAICTQIASERGGLIKFARPGQGSEPEPQQPWLCKLHGSVDDGDLVPPTWRKTSNGPLAAEWRVARQLLAGANHIRILGYSLPASDSYIKYLFKAAFKDSPHLKSVHVVTLDPSGQARARFERFFTFNFFRFKSGDVTEYARQITGAFRQRSRGPYRYDQLERLHAGYFSRDAG